MRRTLAVPAFAMVLLLAGCSEESEPITGEWVADGPQPPGFSDFADRAMIRVDKDGEALLGTSPMSLCGDAKVTAKDEDGGGGKEYRIAFSSACITVNVPVSLEVVVDGDTLEATPTGLQGGKPFRFRRAD
ncbi:hypothetical protein SLUN_01745 [Streptomyces lunaelactis]|uniref:DUF306 domain-containing protein n=1 Tax=Streptomyces lunaelactis TaxID=1535768 RepID=A0A2R4SWA3_9ACTN|nr:hypothetical protein [Streptomyces lunaelactis]AVZ71163.1 hypothetical protein SLUN_01745 [Streptomyces lunaelactis]NUK05378.1 hypothetical protein [Streptomyces lunaelactis]NUK06555.1 hypothetical protein [Streptomyces lunaelactis]NUK16716.1 hypothetical protein [Streptomyces lunaelactis]NUK26846.1 hypothetical protein [Streptomyces lunaelactis]